MAETLVVTVNHCTVLDDQPDSGQPAKKKSDTGSKSPGQEQHTDTHTHARMHTRTHTHAQT